MLSRVEHEFFLIISGPVYAHCLELSNPNISSTASLLMGSSQQDNIYHLYHYITELKIRWVFEDIIAQPVNVGRWAKIFVSALKSIQLLLVVRKHLLIGHFSFSLLFIGHHQLA